MGDGEGVGDGDGDSSSGQFPLTDILMLKIIILYSNNWLAIMFQTLSAMKKEREK